MEALANLGGLKFKPNFYKPFCRNARIKSFGELPLLKLKTITRCKIYKEIPNFSDVYYKFTLFHFAEKTYRENVLNEFISECNLSEFVQKKTDFEKESVYLLQIKKLKEQFLISSTNSVVDRFLSYLEPFPFNDEEISSLEMRNSNLLTLGKIRNIVEKQYLAWKYEISEIHVKEILFRLCKCLYFNRSLSTLKKNISLLETVPFIQEKSLAEKIYHINQRPFKLSNVKNFQEQIAGVVWHVFPQYSSDILKFSHEYILFVVSILKELKFSEKQIQEGLPYLPFKYNFLFRKLENLLETPEIAKYRHEEKFFCLLAVKNQFELKSYISEQKKQKQIDFHDLLSLAKVSCKKKYLRRNFTLRRSIFYLSDLFYDINDSLRTKVIKHPKFKFVPEHQIYDTLSFLKENNFTNEEVSESFNIILYSRFAIVEALKKIKEKEAVLSNFGFKNGCVEQETDFFKNGTKQKRKTLQLCLYYIEKAFNFSGNGVWQINEYVKENNTNASLDADTQSSDALDSFNS